MLKKLFLLISCILLILGVSSARAEPKNVIILIGDGMGFEHVKAAGFYASGAEGNFIFESFPYSGEVTTASANSSITDSAAAASSMATGIKVNNGVISMAIPGDSSELYTLLEYFRDNGKNTGLVSTTYITHATPAAFAAHESSRTNKSAIAQDYLQQTQPNVLFGGGANGMSVADATAAGYTVVTDRADMQSLNTETATMVSGQFGSDNLPYEYDYFLGIDLGYNTLPHLSEMTTTALAILDNDPDGFFLMVEGGRIDHAGHANEIERNIFETMEFNSTVQVVVDWAQGRADTLILVTADHETGGLTVLANNGQGDFPSVSWSTSGHTGVNVPIYATGENAQMVSGVMDNTDIFAIAIATSTPPKICDKGSCVGDIDGNGLDDLIVDFGTANGIWVRYDDETWEQLHGLSPELMIVGDVDNNGLYDLIVDFGTAYGIWVRYDDETWEQLHGFSPEIMIVGDVDGNGDYDLIVDFGTANGIWVRYDDETWEQLHGLSPELMIVGDIDGNGLDDLIVDFGTANGIWVRYDDGTWEQLHGLSPELMIVGDVDGNGNDLIVDFGTANGIWVRYDDGTWEQLHGFSPEIMTVGDLDGNWLDDLIIDFGTANGIWVRYDDGTWEQLHGFSPEMMIVGDVDGNGLDDVIVDFGTAYGIWVRYDDGTWEQLHGLSPDG